MSNKIIKHKIRTNMTYVVKGDVLKTDFQMEIETMDCLDNTTLLDLLHGKNITNQKVTS